MMDDNNKRLQQLAPELRDIIIEQRPSTRSVLFLIVTLVAKAKVEKRAAIWQRFEANRQLADHVKRLRRAFGVVEARVLAKEQAFNDWHQQARKRAVSSAVDGELRGSPAEI